MDRLRAAPHAAAARPPGRWPHPGQLLGAVAPARVLDPLAEAHRHPPRGTVLDFIVFALALIGLRLVIMWVVNNTRGSVLMAILTHASWNTFYSAALIGLFPVQSVLGSYLNLTIAAWVLALVLIALTRGRLGYRPEVAQERVR